MQLEELNAAFTEKVKRGMFDPVARHLTNPDTAEDRMQEALALTWEMEQDRIVNRGLVLDDAILVHAAKQRAGDMSRHLVRDGKCKVHDAMSERDYHAGLVEVREIEWRRGVSQTNRPVVAMLGERLAGRARLVYNRVYNMVCFLV